MERLIATNFAFKLQCFTTCPFGRNCARKYQDGTCVTVIDEEVEKQVYGTPGDKSFKGGWIAFETQDPKGKVLIGGGIVSISR